MFTARLIWIKLVVQHVYITTEAWVGNFTCIGLIEFIFLIQPFKHIVVTAWLYLFFLLQFFFYVVRIHFFV